MLAVYFSRSNVSYFASQFTVLQILRLRAPGMLTYFNSEENIDTDVNLTTNNKIIYVFITEETTTSKPL